MSDLFIEAWGTGAPVVLVHGSLATGAEEWQAQQPLAERRAISSWCSTVVVTARAPQSRARTSCGTPPTSRTSSATARMSLPTPTGDSVPCSRRRSDPGRSTPLALLEPAASTLASTDAARDLVDAIRNMWDQDLPDKVWLARFLEAVGTEMETLPAEILEGAAPLVPVLRKGRPAWDREPPVAELAAARFPKLVVSGGHSEGFEAICDELADQIGAARAVVEGAGHEIQFTGAPINDALRNLWAGAG